MGRLRVEVTISMPTPSIAHMDRARAELDVYMCIYVYIYIYVLANCRWKPRSIGPDRPRGMQTTKNGPLTVRYALVSGYVVADGRRLYIAVIIAVRGCRRQLCLSPPS